MIMLAKNLRGWHNLIRITSEAHSSGFYQSPCADWDLQERHGEGIMVSTSCVLGPLAYLIENGTDAQVDDWIKRGQSIHGDDLFFAIMPHDFDRQRALNLEIVSRANKFGAPIVHEKDSHYPERGWVDTQKIAILIGTNTTFAEAEEENRKRIANGQEVYELWHDDLHISSEDEDRAMYARYHPDLPESVVDEAMRNTHVIASRVDPLMPDKSLKMPKSAKATDDPREIVLDWCYEGLKRIGKRHDPVYEGRLEYEASVIDGQNAWGYFYFIGDLVRWARSDAHLPRTLDDPEPALKQPIRINSGRGSGAASIVCFLSRITMIDPIPHKFKFERFMNPERRSMPDIDLDIASSRRALMKEYCRRKYGAKNVADIVAMQHFQPRAALQNVTRTMYGFDHTAFKQIAALTHEKTGVIDPVNDTDLEVLRLREPGLDNWSKAWPEAWEHARRLENAGDPSVLRLSKHAAGVVVTPCEITDVMATIKSSEDEEGFRTAWAETTRISVVDELGIVKGDLLGIKGMDQQQLIVDMIREHTGEEIDLDALPVLRDPYAVEPEVMEVVFCGALTKKVNQFGSDGIRDFLRRAHPENIVDLAAINALYRPGPLGSGGHNRYVKRKRGEDASELPEILKPVLGDTYGSIAFQEQVMELFEVLVGYTPGQADDIRKIIAKYYRDKGGLAAEKLAEHRAEFIEAASKLVGLEYADGLWTEIEPYCNYSFNRAHAGSYVVQSYQDGWLKKHYSIFFYAVCLSLNEKETAEILREARAFDVSVLPPDINVSRDGFTPDFDAGAIRFGLRGIKGIGDAVADQIAADRPFRDLEDFTERSSRKYSKVNKAAREKLIKVGALDCFGARDDGMMAWLDEQTGEGIYWTPALRAQFELEMLGLALEPGGMLGEDGPLVRQHIYSEQEIADAQDGDQVTIGGAVRDLKPTVVKKGRQSGQSMARFKIALDLEEWICVSFPNSWRNICHLVVPGALLMLKGKVNDRRDIVVADAMDMREFIIALRTEPQE